MIGDRCKIILLLHASPSFNQFLPFGYSLPRAEPKGSGQALSQKFTHSLPKGNSFVNFYSCLELNQNKDFCNGLMILVLLEMQNN